MGINDADYAIQIMETRGCVDGKPKQKQVWRCPFYTKWAHMLGRCYSRKNQERNPTYTGCSVCEEWLTFSNFKAWMETQDWEGNQLDKDLLFTGNKIYNAAACVFVPSVVNTFVLECTASKGDWPVGVYWDGQAQKFKAQCSNPFTSKREHLGLFTNSSEAHQAWLTRKLELAKMLAAEQDDPRVAKALINKYENYNGGE